ncbi:MAG: GDP-mannose 4,6-dehydratase, partial [Desulfobacterales bacterium]|nr:GDP-mannose 4,6-dehydratase [Desulfobacterales bacterium]
CLYLGNLDAKRDWGHARDYVMMQWLMLQQEEAEDFVIATGKQYAVREFVNVAAQALGMEIIWEGKGLQEKGVDQKSGKTIVRIDPKYFRPTEVDSLLGDSTKAQQKLGWKPKISFNSMVAEMVAFDLKIAKKDHLCQSHGFDVFKYGE